ncbi:hypothetical protein [Mangrovibacillus cuniculi]|uniref:Uncharacterized protein n=1 Tax=Mangrovibacillus cuniculi TaxID=2593652 RepID=A0A7S8C8Y7_9BACI|nr:hypothetical protein [Mangrovibacillus cuniculi]QPC45528.1 hypothetical protein G8O30_00315 [Mangrovibacillus cuniculi]
MGHDIYGLNKKGKEIAYARFSMSNSNARILYRVLNAQDKDGGVSGIGAVADFDFHQMESARKTFLGHTKDLRNIPPGSLAHHDIQQISTFLTNCKETAHREGKVQVYFG